MRETSMVHMATYSASSAAEGRKEGGIIVGRR